MSEPDVEEVRCTVVEESPGAFRLAQAHEPHGPEWFPKSQVSFARRNTHTGEAVAEIPAWLLKDRGWID